MLAANIVQFARILRRIGLPVGPGKVALALEALNAIDISHKEDVFAALHAVFVERHTHRELFAFAFERFWRAPKIEQISLDEFLKPELKREPARPEPRRVTDAFAKPQGEIRPVMEAEIQASWSSSEQLRAQDFETMSAAEAAEAKRLMAALRLPVPALPTRRFKPASTGRIDMRATLRAMMRTGVIALRKRRRRERRPPLVVLCDISGSMGAYARMLLHFLHSLANDSARVHVFLFGTRLTNVTRELALRDPDAAIARVSGAVKDWSGGTRIGEVLRTFNRFWARRVLGQGAVVLLITDGLDRDAGEGLGVEMERLHRSCRRLIWLNPLLRYAGFEPKSAGVKAMLPHVDDFRPVHNLDSLAALVAALSEDARKARAA
ncbi:MAG: vWA domain-containing protein [Rhodospirillaceae bacterium]